MVSSTSSRVKCFCSLWMSSSRPTALTSTPTSPNSPTWSPTPICSAFRRRSNTCRAYSSLTTTSILRKNWVQAKSQLCRCKRRCKRTTIHENKLLKIMKTFKIKEHTVMPIEIEIETEIETEITQTRLLIRFNRNINTIIISRTMWKVTDSQCQNICQIVGEI